MSKILASETLTVAVLTVLFAGDFYRNLLTVPGWVALALACAAWAITVIVSSRVSWRVLPWPLIVTLAWIALSPLVSPYALSSAGLTLGFALTVAIAVALSVVVPFDELIRRAGTALRLILGASIVFEIVVALTGKPIYPVGMNAPPGTSIELAWSRAIFFHGSGRIQGIVGNANLLGMLGLLLAIIAIATLVHQTGSRRLAIVDLVLAAIILVKTSSTTVALAAVAVLGVWVVLWLARRSTIPSRIAIGAIVAGGLAGVVYALTHWSAVLTRLGKSPDLTHRFDIWKAVLARIADRPVTGSGFVGWWPSWDSWFHIHSIRNIPVAQAHNVWLDLMMQVGLIGAALFAVTLIVTGWGLWRGARVSPSAHAVIALGFLVAMVVQSLTESRMLSEWGIAFVVILAIVAKRRTALT